MANINYLNKIKVLDASGKVSPGEEFNFALGSIRVDETSKDIVYDKNENETITLFKYNKTDTGVTYQLMIDGSTSLQDYIESQEKVLKSVEYDQVNKQFVFTWNYNREDDTDGEPNITRISIDELNITADTIYFTDNLTTTYEMGNYNLTNGSATILAEGKSLREVWDMIYLKEDTKITIGSPSIELTVADSGKTVEVGSTFTRPTATLKIKSIGSYEYGSKDAEGNEYTSTTATGVTFSSMKVGFGSNIDAENVSASELTAGGYVANKTLTYTADADDIESVLVSEGTTSFTFCAEAHHTASDRYPVTNLGNYIIAGSMSDGILTGTTLSDNPKNTKGEIIAKGAIAASATDGLEKTATWKITGYREGFYFGTSETAIAPANLTSKIIRELTTKSGANYTPGTKDVTIPVNAKTVIIACPSDKTGVTNIHNTTANANMNESFGVGGTPTKIMVGGNDATTTSVGKFKKEYNVWTFTPPEAYGTAASLTITLG